MNQAHNLEIAGSNPTPQPKSSTDISKSIYL